jgi:DTW domain-containing protein YfiP
MEVKHAKGSARLLCLSLSNSQIEIGESFTPHRLQELLTAPWLANTSAQGQKLPILLYPELPHDAANNTDALANFTPQELSDPTHLRLIVIDASWRKSRKMLYLNPLLQGLPRLHLDEIPASKYHIRKAQRADQLSTYEATCAALMQLEGENAAFDDLLTGFEGFVRQLGQSSERPRDALKKLHFSFAIYPPKADCYAK